ITVIVMSGGGEGGGGPVVTPADIAAGTAQGLADSANGAQDGAIGTVNMLASALRYNAVPAGAQVVLTEIPEPAPLPSPDWSKDLFVSSNIYPHELNKGIGGASLSILVGNALSAGLRGPGVVASVWDDSITAAGSRFPNVATNVTAQEFQANLI